MSTTILPRGAACVNLKERFGGQYKILHEESYFAQYGPRATRADPWLQIIPGRLGHVFPHGGDLLAASTNTAGSTARRLAALPGAVLWLDGSDGVTVLFPVEELETVAAILHLRRRRVLSEAARAHLRVLGAKYGFKPGVGCPETSAVCVGSPRVDLGHLPMHQGLFDGRNTA